MNKGFLCIVLHAHLPYIRHPEHEYFLEENWLYEAVIETYIPLLKMFEGLADDGVDFRITLSLSPTLIEMLKDRLLMERCKRHIERLIELSNEEVYRTKRDIHFGPVAGMYRERFVQTLRLFEDVYKRDIVSRFGALQDEGSLEIIATSATHAFLPSFSQYPLAAKTQISLGADYYRSVFVRRPGGIWLPECGFAEGFDDYLEKEGIKFCFLDTHGIMCGSPPPPSDVYLPVRCPSGVFAFGRDVETSEQVWSSVSGYPGDFYYRDFYRDIGFDFDTGHVRSFLQVYGAKTFTGLKYYRITGKSVRKEPYVRDLAIGRAMEHARNFIHNREIQVSYLSGKYKVMPVVTAMYDAELFGHWWFEGPEWLDFLLRGVHSGKTNFRTVSPSAYIGSREDQLKALKPCRPSMSSWGEKGYCEVWLNKTNDYVYRHIFKTAERMSYLVKNFPGADGILRRALNQALRELLLSQQSDWAFMMKNGSNRGYAEKRFKEHISRFNHLYQSILSGSISEGWLALIEDRDTIFKDLDYTVYGGKDQDISL